MTALIWCGAALTLLGVAGLLACVLVVLRARRAGLDDTALRATLARVVVWNMAALAVSALGLMAVALGVILA
jgi:hypothetical protein